MHPATCACERMSVFRNVLPTSFYDRALETVAWELLGKLLVHDYQGSPEGQSHCEDGSLPRRQRPGESYLSRQNGA